MNNVVLWKPIKGYGGLYEVSNTGKVKSFKNQAKYKEGRMLKTDNKRYPTLMLYGNGKGKRFLVHRLVAETFIPNLENKSQVNHKDGNKKNNHVSNLEWCTSKENIEHALVTGIGTIGERNGLSKFTNKQIKYLRKIYKPYDSRFGGAALARKYGTSNKTMHMILSNQSYKNID